MATNTRNSNSLRPATLRLTVQNKEVERPSDLQGTIFFTNTTEKAMTIVSRGNLFQYLSFSFKDTNGNEFVTDDYGAAYAIFLDDVQEVIESGRTIKSSVAPGIVIDDNGFQPGEYSLRATFCYQGILAQSDVVKVIVRPRVH